MIRAALRAEWNLGFANNEFLTRLPANTGPGLVKQVMNYTTFQNQPHLILLFFGKSLFKPKRL